MSKATQALMTARNKEKKTSQSFESAKIVRKSEKPSGARQDRSSGDRYSMKSGGRDNSSRSTNDQAAPVDHSYSGSKSSGFKGRGADAKKKTTEEQERQRGFVKKDKRNAVSTRDLLSNYGSDEDSAQVTEEVKRKRPFTLLLVVKEEITSEEKI